MLGDLSILIVTWNGDDFLCDCLNSLRQSCGESPEVVVVDNASSETTKALVAQYKNCLYVGSAQNVGFAGGNNIGLGHCTRRYVALLNNDTVVHDDPFTPLMEYLRTNTKVGVVQGTLKLCLHNDTLDTCGTLMTAIGKLHLCHFREPISTARLHPMAVFSAKGAFMLFERRLVEIVGGGLFHDHFFNNYEETDFCHRVWLSGLEVHFVPTPPVDHLYNATIKRLPSVDVRARELSNALFSLHSLLGGYGKIRLLSLFYLYRILMVVRQSLFGSFEYAQIFGLALKMLWRRRKEMWSMRMRMQQMRKVTDRELFGRIMYSPPQGYWGSMIKIWIKGGF